MIYVINNGDDEDDNAEVHITSIINIWNHFSKQCMQFQFDLRCLNHNTEAYWLTLPLWLSNV